MKFKKYLNYKIYENGEIYSEYKKKMLSQWDANGYKQCTIKHDGKFKTRYVHIIVAENFIPNKESKPCVNHKDGNKSNNHWTNLEWCTHKENTSHAIMNNLMAPAPIKATKTWQKNREIYIRAMRCLYLNNFSKKEISKLLQLEESRVGQIIAEINSEV